MHASAHRSICTALSCETTSAALCTHTCRCAQQIDCRPFARAKHLRTADGAMIALLVSVFAGTGAVPEHNTRLLLAVRQVHTAAAHCHATTSNVQEQTDPQNSVGRGSSQIAVPAHPRYVGRTTITAAPPPPPPSAATTAVQHRQPHTLLKRTQGGSEISTSAMHGGSMQQRWASQPRTTGGHLSPQHMAQIAHTVTRTAETHSECAGVGFP